MQILSEFSSSEEEEEAKDQRLNQTAPFTTEPENKFGYIDDMFAQPNETDLRYLTLYN